MKSTLKNYHLFIFFIDFLYKRSDFYQFYDNFLTHGNRLFHPTFFKFITSIPPEFFVCGAFKFAETPQGFEYWHKVDLAWRRFLIKREDK